MSRSTRTSTTHPVIKQVPDESSSSSGASSGCDDATCISILGISSPFAEDAELSIEGVFPALASSFKLFEGLATKGDISSIRNFAPVFIGNLFSAYRQLKNVPKEVNDNTRFLFSKYQLRYCLNVLRSRVDTKLPQKPSKEQRADYLQHVTEDLETVKIRLNSFLTVLNDVVIKPLSSSSPGSSINVRLSSTKAQSSGGSPPLPPKDIASVAARPTGAPPAKPPFAPTPLMKPTPLAPISYSTDTLVTHKTTSSSRSFLRKMLRAFSMSKLSLTSPSSFNLLDLAHPSDTSTITDFIHPKKLPDMPYEPRRSAIYFPVGVDFSKVNIEELMPTPDDGTIRLTSEGKLKAASLTSLVRILTSPEALRIPDFTHIFFMAFRFFTTPLELFKHLIARFNVLSVWMKPNLDKATSGLISLQAEEVRVSVVRAFTTWLWEYWRPETDSHVLPQILKFATHDVVGNVPDLKYAWSLAQAAWRIDSGKGQYGNKVKPGFTLSSQISPPKSTGYNIFKLCTDGPPSARTVFDLEQGREEFTRQITLKLSRLFCAVNPSDAIMLWRGRLKGLDKARRLTEELHALESATCIWVLETLLAESGPVNRSILLEFWIDVATRCVAYRNFNSAYSIYCGISNSAIARMKITIGLASPRHKAQFLALQTLFIERNYVNYRKEVRDVKRPTVPLIMVLKHDLSAAEAMSTQIPSVDGEKTLINYSPVRTMMDVMSCMDNCRVQYHFSPDENFQDWLKGQLRPHHYSPQQETRHLNDLYVSSKRLEANIPPALLAADVWTNSIQFFYPEYPGPFRTDVPPG